MDINALTNVVQNASDSILHVNDVVTNITINAANSAINTSSATLQQNIGTFWADLFIRLGEIIAAPVFHRQMLWIITPMVITLVMMQLYFGRYKQEELGWNTAVGNSLVLIFVSIDLLRQIYGDSGFIEFVTKDLFLGVDVPLKTLIAMSILMYGLFLLIFNFFHILPKQVAFLISSSLVVNYIAYLSIVTVYSNFPIIEKDGYLTIIASIILFMLLWLFFSLIKTLEPSEQI